MNELSLTVPGASKWPSLRDKILVTHCIIHPDDDLADISRDLGGVRCPERGGKLISPVLRYVPYQCQARLHPDPVTTSQSIQVIRTISRLTAWETRETAPIDLAGLAIIDPLASHSSQEVDTPTLPQPYLSSNGVGWWIAHKARDMLGDWGGTSLILGDVIDWYPKKSDVLTKGFRTSVQNNMSAFAP